jgi:hypothetical protein
MAETIYAPSTLIGKSGVTVVRISGPESRAALHAIVGRAELPAPRRASLRRLSDPSDGALLDQAIVLWMAAPASFTGEDMAELHLHGGRAVAQAVLARAAVTPDPRRRIEGAKELLSNTGSGGASDREKLASHLRAMASLVRDVELLSTRADVRALANADVQPALERLMPAYGGDRGARAFSAIDRALVALDRNAGVKIVADWLVLQL